VTHTHTYTHITRYLKHYKNETLDSNTHAPTTLSKTEPAPQNPHNTHDTTERNTHHQNVSTHSTTLKESPMYFIHVHKILAQFIITCYRHTTTYAAHRRNYALDL
jgi:hypothetical protein